MSQNDIREIEVSIEEAKKIAKRAERVRRLEKNPDFKALILEGYFTEEAARLAHLVTDPQVIQGGHLDFVQNDLKGIGALKRFLTATLQLGDIAAQEVKEYQEALEEIRAEEDVE